MLGSEIPPSRNQLGNLDNANAEEHMHFQTLTFLRRVRKFQSFVFPDKSFPGRNGEPEQGRLLM